jgi:DNA-binding transcriptional MerR regulator
MSPRPTALTYPIRPVAQMTGLSIDTLRAWERRYDAVTPRRAERGRVYRDAEVARLRHLAELVDRGHAIGTIARLTALVRAVGGTCRHLETLGDAVSMASEPKARRRG